MSNKNDMLRKLLLYIKSYHRRLREAPTSWDLGTENEINELAKGLSFPILCERYEESSDGAMKGFWIRYGDPFESHFASIPISRFDGALFANSPESMKSIYEIFESWELKLNAELLVNVTDRISKVRDWLGGESANVAIVFTDLVESTRAELRLGGEAYRKLRQAHFRRARELIARYNGIEIKTIGDSFMALFRTSIDSLDFAIELHKDAGNPELKVRAGIHLGIVFEQDGDVFGSDVSLASRAVGEAKLDQIYLTEEAKKNIDREKPQRFNEIVWIRHERDIKEGKIVLWEVMDGEVNRETDEAHQAARVIERRQRQPKPAIATHFPGFFKQISFEWEMETRSGNVDPNRIQAILERVRRTLVEYAKDFDETMHADLQNRLLEAAAQTANALRLNPFKGLAMVQPDQWMDQASVAIQLLASLGAAVEKTQWE